MSVGPEELIAHQLGDHRVTSIAWSDDGKNLLLAVRPPGEIDGRVVIEFVWATNVRIDLDFGTYLGEALVWEGRVEAIPDSDRRSVRIDFGGTPRGFIRVVCNEVRYPPNDSHR